MKNIISLVILCLTNMLLVYSCGNSKKPGLSDNQLFGQQDSIELQELYSSETIADTIPPGVKYEASKANDPANPPVVLNYANRNLNEKTFNPADYYSKAHLVKLKPPGTETSLPFIQNSQMMMMGMDDFEKISTDFCCLLIDDYIIAGSLFAGLHCYDKDGNFMYTISESKFTHKTRKDPKSKEVKSLDVDLSELSGFTGHLSANGGNCIYTMREGKDYFVCFHNLKTKKTYSKVKYTGGSLALINPEVYGVYRYSPVEFTENYFQTFDVKGDTLCRFSNLIPVVEVNNNYTDPDKPFIYQLNSSVFVRQSYNDTIYRIQSEKWMSPAYILNFGSYHLDAQTGVKGDKSNKFIPEQWMETDQYILFVYTENYDCQTNREGGKVKFFFSYYDKKSRMIYHIPSENKFQEALLINNSLEGGIPLQVRGMKSQGKQLMVYYSKPGLNRIIQLQDFGKLSANQQTKVKEVYDQMASNEILVMILE